MMDTPDSEPAGDETPLEFPEPENVTVRRRRRRGVLALGSALVALLAIVAVLYFSPALEVRQVEVSGNELLTDARAAELTADLHGRPLPQVSTADVHALLAEENVVAEVETHAELPHTLHIEITEHPPVAEVQDDDAVRYYNEDGEVIREFTGAESLDAEDYATPEISADAAYEDDVVFSAIVSVLGQLPESARARLDEAAADSADSVTLHLDDGRAVVWGSDERSQEKAAVLTAILESEAEEFTEAEVIDISTPEAPVTR
ncbi:cell division protein FtsQ/DivIB [Nesterenkonia alba]|uniref:cell division protein FtsQ/DivIB n=1 Tax=Nesterenkonia alba TaxID=515814 RepID=UPI0004265948|nr:cell division protein FtsQ/DivIB [Nesterenkonia alba]